HVLYPTLHISDPEDPGDGGVGSASQLVLYSRDGSYLRASRTRLSDPWQIRFPNGQEHTFTNFGPASDYRLTRIADPFNNDLDVTYSPDNLTWTLADGHRTHKIIFTDPGVDFPYQRRLVDKVYVRYFKAVDNDYAEYSFQYDTLTVTRPPAHTHGPRDLPVKVLAQIIPPAGNPWVIRDALHPGYRAGEGGVMTHLQLPTLGRLEWDWQGFHFPKFRTLPPNQEEEEAIEPFNRVVGVSKRRQVGIDEEILGEWTYDRELDHEDDGGSQLPEKLTVTVTTPLNDKSLHYFSVYPSLELIGQPDPQWGTRLNEYSLPYTRETEDGTSGRFLSSEVFDCDEPTGATCTKVRSVYVTYELDDAANLNDSTGKAFNKNRRLKSRRTYFDDDPDGASVHWKQEASSEFDGLGHYRTTVTEGSFGPTRTVTVEFNPDSGTYPDSYKPWLST
ncbi:MAG: hypothetical protein GY722_02855, partial [bacterium]|nr:hypothetical protein [bacterium]